MWILQEYKFFLIIAIIALVSIIALFFNTQKSQEYVDFNTNLQASFAQIKSTASNYKSIKDVITIDWKEIKGLKNNSLFWNVLEWNASEILLADEFDNSSYPWGTEPNPAAWKFAMTLATTSVWTINAPITLWTINTNSGSIDKGWDLDTNGYILYTFTDASTAKNIIDKYLPEWTLVWTKTVATPLPTNTTPFVPSIVNTTNLAVDIIWNSINTNTSDTPILDFKEPVTIISTTLWTLATTFTAQAWNTLSQTHTFNFTSSNATGSQTATVTVKDSDWNVKTINYTRTVNSPF